MKKKIEGKNLVKDTNTGVILNTDSGAISQARARKRFWKQQQEEIKSLRVDVEELKKMIKKLTKGNKDGS